MESRFDADFSSVRVHDGPGDRQDAAQMGARAFTHQNDIWLGENTSSNDRALMAHELTHVLQQGAGVRRKTIEPRAGDAETGDRGDAASSGPVPDGRPGTPQPPTVAETDPSSERTGTASPGLDRKEADVVLSDAPQVQAAWYNFDIPFTDYRFDPSIRGVKTAAGLAKGVATEAAGWVKETAESGFEWVFEKIQRLVSAGVDWLGEQLVAIRDFAASAISSIRSSFNGMVARIISPFSRLMAGMASMSADLVLDAWSTLASGVSVALAGARATVAGVIQVGEGLWAAASGYVSNLLGTIATVVDSWPFRQLPNALQRRARAMVARLRELWGRVRAYLTGVLRRVSSFGQDVVNALVALQRRVADVAIDRVVQAMQALRQTAEFVDSVTADPQGYIQPLVGDLERKLNAEAPAHAIRLGREQVQQHTSEGGSSRAGVVQRQSNRPDVGRTTATPHEIVAGFTDAIQNAWSQLEVGTMLADTLANLFWPPATIRAIGHEFSLLWSTDWTNAAAGLFLPRTDSISGFAHDLWSNILTLLDFPLALWRRLNAVFMLLLGYATVLLVLAGGIAGGILAGGVSAGAAAVPGALAGATAGLKLAGTIGIALLKSFFAAETVSVVKALMDLLSARQTDAEKRRDYVQMAASLIGMGAAAALVAVLYFFSALVGALVRNVRARARPSKAAQDAPAKPGRAAEPSKTPERAESASERPKAGTRGAEPVEAVPGHPGFYRVRVDALKSTTPTLAGGPTSVWSWKLYVELPNGKVAVFCEVTIKPLISRGSPDLNLHPKTATVKGADAVNLHQFSEIAWTSESLKLVIETYRARFGSAPKNLGGWLAKKNLLNFQKEFARIRAMNPGMSMQEVARRAVAEISFGRNRIRIGYSEFEVTILEAGNVKLPKGGVLRGVPKKVQIQARTPAEPAGGTAATGFGPPVGPTAADAADTEESPQESRSARPIQRATGAASVGSGDGTTTHLPDELRARLESASGEDLSGVRVHSNSSSPARLDALAFTQGQDIHLGPWQEKHLPHEAWHVVQQLQGRVRPTSELGGIPINSDPALEAEADAMGARVDVPHAKDTPETSARRSRVGSTIAQLQGDETTPVFEAYRGRRVAKTGRVSATARDYQIAITRGVNVRAKPDGTLRDIAKVRYGTEVHVRAFDNTGAFYFIIARTGEVGWINRDYVVTDPPDHRARLHHITEDNLTTILKDQYVDKRLWSLRTGNDYTTLAAAIVVANEGRRGVSVDWSAAQKYKSEHWGRRLLDPWMIDNFAIYHGSKILRGHNIWLPSPQYVRTLQKSGAIGSRPGWVNAAVELGKGIAGFLAGIVAGVFGSVWDTLTGLWDLGKGIVNAIKSTLDGSLLSSAAELYEKLKAMSWSDVKNMVDELISMGKGAFSNFLAKWEHPDLYKQWHFKGYIVGAVALEVILAILTAGATLGIKVLAKVGKYVPKLMSVLKKLLALADDLPGRKRRRRKTDADDDGRDRRDERGDRDMSWAQALGLARALAHAHDTADTPAMKLVSDLNRDVATRSKAVHRYEAVRKGAPHTFTILQRAKKSIVDPHYTEAGAPDEADSNAPLVPQTAEHKAQRWLDYQAKHPKRFPNPTKTPDPTWSRQYDTILANKRAGGAFERGALAKLGRKPNQALMIDESGGAAGFIPDSVAGNPKSLKWGQPYHFTEVKGWAKMSDTGNLKRMIEYVERFPGSRITVVFRSSKQPPKTTLSGPLRRKLAKLMRDGQAFVKFHP